MTCKLCGADVDLIDAHIIPRPFFSQVDAGRNRAKVLTNKEGQYPKRLPIGFYDSHLLCGPCDNTIGQWDSYGIDLLIHQRNQLKPVPNAKSPIAFVRDDFNYARFKLFFLSVLWRAHESSLPFFECVELGSYRARLLEMISKSDPGPPEEFSVLLSAFTVNGVLPDAGTPILDPHAEQWNGVNAYRVSFGVITAYIKVDHAPFEGSFSQLILAPNRQLSIVAREFVEGGEARVTQSIIRAPHNERAFRRGSPVVDPDNDA